MNFYQISNILENIQGLIQIKQNEKLQMSIINNNEIQVANIEKEINELQQQYNIYNDLLREYMMSNCQGCCVSSGLCYQKY